MTGTDTMTNVDAIVVAYFAMWNETDPAARRAIITATWSPEASYLDPLFAADGYDALDAMVAGVHRQFPDHRFRLTGPVDVHHDRARWGWELAGPGSTPIVVAGIDFAMFAPDGRLRAVTGFFEQPTSPAA